MRAVAERTATLFGSGEAEQMDVVNVLRTGLGQPNRAACLEIIGILGKQIRDIGGPQAVADCAEAIRQTAAWWP
jgi:hypothetical protein